MESQELKQYTDIVTVVNRSSGPVEFQWDSQVFSFGPNETKPLPRFIALHGVGAVPLKVDAHGIGMTQSFLGIVGLDSYPTTPLKETTESVKDEPKLDLSGEEMVSEGKRLTMRKKFLGSAPRETFVANNQG